MRTFTSGATVMACWVIALFFVRFWRKSHDRLFAIFAVAFLVLSANWVALAIVDPSNETRHWFYVLRLIAFGLIIWAIVDKNRAPDRR